ncbi:MAG: hypothetical protein QM765_04135 [Myxococcales bacterium]
MCPPMPMPERAIARASSQLMIDPDPSDGRCRCISPPSSLATRSSRSVFGRVEMSWSTVAAACAAIDGPATTLRPGDRPTPASSATRSRR